MKLKHACGQRERARGDSGFFSQAVGIRAGDEVVLQIQDDELRITTLKRNIERAQRLVRKHVKPGTSLVDELMPNGARPREMSRVVLDASALLAILNQEPEPKGDARAFKRRSHQHRQSGRSARQTGRPGTQL